MTKCLTRPLVSLPSDGAPPDFVVAFCDAATMNVRLTETVRRKKAMMFRLLSFLVVYWKNTSDTLRVTKRQELILVTRRIE